MLREILCLFLGLSNQIPEKQIDVRECTVKQSTKANAKAARDLTDSGTHTCYLLNQ